MIHTHTCDKVILYGETPGRLFCLPDIPSQGTLLSHRGKTMVPANPSIPISLEVFFVVMGED
jgi:hypothetical protein